MGSGNSMNKPLVSKTPSKDKNKSRGWGLGFGKPE